MSYVERQFACSSSIFGDVAVAILTVSHLRYVS